MSIFLGVALILVVVSFAQTPDNQQTKPLFHKTITWSAGKNPVPWKTTVSTSDGQKYRLSLIPLWAVEGGIVAIEISLADSNKPERNLLGERNDEPQPFVVTVEELEAGIQKSKFGATRVFAVGTSKLGARIKDSQLGSGVGSCETCRNIRALKITFTIE